MSTEDRYMVWSHEHRAWWKSNHVGYTLVTAEAGRYTEAEADEIVRRANYRPDVNNEVACLAPRNHRDVIEAHHSWSATR